MTTRREFVKGAALAAAAATPALAKRDTKKKMLIVNALGDLGNPNLALARPQSDNPVALDEPDIDARTFRDAHAAGLSAINVTLGYVGGPGEPFEYTMRTIGMWDEICRANPNELLK